MKYRFAQASSCTHCDRASLPGLQHCNACLEICLTRKFAVLGVVAKINIISADEFGLVLEQSTRCGGSRNNWN